MHNCASILDSIAKGISLFLRFFAGCIPSLHPHSTYDCIIMEIYTCMIVYIMLSVYRYVSTSMGVYGVGPYLQVHTDHNIILLRGLQDRLNGLRTVLVCQCCLCLSPPSLPLDLSLSLSLSLTHTHTHTAAAFFLTHIGLPHKTMIQPT